MLIQKPSYYHDFRCIAGACPDSCCKEWDVQVDAASAEAYRNLTGPLGDRLREVLRWEDGEAVMTIIDGRCPMWRQDGLCRIQAELGEEALCKTCREFPRLTHDYGDYIEYGLELSCPEAARIILSTPAAPPIVEEICGGDAPEYDTDAMDLLKQTRARALELLEDPNYTPQQALALLLLYGSQVQSELDGEEPSNFDPEAAMETIRSFARPASVLPMAEFFSELEILTPQWEQILKTAHAPKYPQGLRLLARYFVERYWLQAVSDYDLLCRVKFVLISCILICSLEGDFVSVAQLFSKETENNYDNVEAILDAAYRHPAFTDMTLLGLLTESNS